MMIPSERVTVTLPRDIVEAIDQAESNRSRFVADAVVRELARRRRAGLLQSIKAPHSESVALAEAGLGDWGSEPDAGLVDLKSGTRVRWVPGKGFVAR
jgi:hypothetical protein